MRALFGVFVKGPPSMSVMRFDEVPLMHWFISG